MTEKQNSKQYDLEERTLKFANRNWNVKGKNWYKRLLSLKIFLGPFCEKAYRVLDIRYLSFDIVSDFDIRISSFEYRKG